MNTKIHLPVIFVKPVFKVDRSVKLEFETRELNGVSLAILADARQTEGWLVYAMNNDITEEDIPDEKADSMTGTKTQAQRIRAVLYKLWEQHGKKQDFESFYKSSTEKIIDQLKERLE